MHSMTLQVSQGSGTHGYRFFATRHEPDHELTSTSGQPIAHLAAIIDSIGNQPSCYWHVPEDFAAHKEATRFEAKLNDSGRSSSSFQL
jgi:hypothetical protein